MVCDIRATEARAKRERERQLAELEKQLKEKSARIVRNGNTVTIEGWSTRGGWCDACAIRKLRNSADAFIRQQVAVAAPAGQVLTYGHGH